MSEHGGGLPLEERSQLLGESREHNEASFEILQEQFPAIDFRVASEFMDDMPEGRWDGQIAIIYDVLTELPPDRLRGIHTVVLGSQLQFNRARGFLMLPLRSPASRMVKFLNNHLPPAARVPENLPIG